jgi:DNA-binding winged helix-turn-helix (wHTH) protein
MAAERVQFGQFVLDMSRYELTRAGKPVRMERIPMDLLILLVRKNGRLISREEIIRATVGKGRLLRHRQQHQHCRPKNSARARR